MKYLLIAVSMFLSACGTDPLEHNFYSYYHGYQVIQGEPSNVRPLSWGSTQVPFNRFDPNH